MTPFNHAPIPRHESLAPFSRDHYTGLVQAQHLLKASQQDDVARRKAVAEFVDAWDHEIAEHFRDEEQLLLDLLTDDDRHQLLHEHEKLTACAKEARDLRQQVNPEPASLKRIGELLNDHIRWEERVLFTRLQDTLSKAQLADLQKKTQALEANRPRNICRSRPQAEENQGEP